MPDKGWKGKPVKLKSAIIGLDPSGAGVIGITFKFRDGKKQNFTMWYSDFKKIEDALAAWRFKNPTVQI